MKLSRASTKNGIDVTWIWIWPIRTKKKAYENCKSFFFLYICRWVSQQCCTASLSATIIFLRDKFNYLKMCVCVSVSLFRIAICQSVIELNNLMAVQWHEIKSGDPGDTLQLCANCECKCVRIELTLINNRSLRRPRTSYKQANTPGRRQADTALSENWIMTEAHINYVNSFLTYSIRFSIVAHAVCVCVCVERARARIRLPERQPNNWVNTLSENN